MTAEHKSWQKETALKKVAALKVELAQAAAPISEQYLAHTAAAYVGAKSGDVLKWMRGQ
jgi:hypothetical protein